MIPATELDPAPESRRRIWFEIAVVAGLNLGASAVYSIVNIVTRLTAGTPLGEQMTQLNPARSPRPGVDLTLQLLSTGFAIFPVLLALYLLTIRRTARPLGEAIGLNWRGRDWGWGVGLAAAVGIPGLAFYALGRAIGITVEVSTVGLDAHWWTIPVLILSALRHGIVEEFLVVAYLFERTRDLGWRAAGRSGIDWRFVAISSVFRGSYHLYQGIGPFLANIAMGVLFAWWYQSRWGGRRVLPLVIAHWLINTVAFVGYGLLPAAARAWLGF